MLKLSFTSLHGVVVRVLVEMVVGLRRLRIHVRLELAKQVQPVIQLLAILGALLLEEVQYAGVLRYRDVIVVRNLELVDQVGGVRGVLVRLLLGGGRLSLLM